MFGKKKKKRSFLERMTGSIDVENYEEDPIEERHYGDEEVEGGHEHRKLEIDDDQESLGIDDDDDDDTGAEGELSVDVMQTDDDIVIKAMVAGVKPSDLDIDISRDMVTITGTREGGYEEGHDNFYHKELYWGSFSRNILLPEEIDVDEAEALEKHGLLTLKLPKLDKNRKTKLQVKTR
jgi:HSP20 family protein